MRKRERDREGERHRDREGERERHRERDREKVRLQITEIKAHYPFSHFLFAYHM